MVAWQLKVASNIIAPFGVLLITMGIGGIIILPIVKAV
jgi:hypothetical protein